MRLNTTTLDVYFMLDLLLALPARYLHTFAHVNEVYKAKQQVYLILPPTADIWIHVHCSRSAIQHAFEHDSLPGHRSRVQPTASQNQ